MIEIIGLLYGAAKDLKDYIEWDEQEKLIERKWLETSGLKAKAEAQGFSLRWTTQAKVQSRVLEGYEYIYEVEKIKRTRSRLVLIDGSVLLGKKA